MGVRRCVSAWVLQTTTTRQMKWKTKNEHTRDGGKSILTPILQIHIVFQLFGKKGERIYHERPNVMDAYWRLGQNLGLLGHLQYYLN